MRTLTLLILCALANLCAAAGEGQFRIYWIDVEGGAATLMVTPAGESILVDTGNPGVRDANRIVRVATQEANLRKIDHLITTHYHRDHFGGAALLSTLLPVGTVYDNGEFENMPDNPGKEYFGFACDRRVVLQPNDELQLKQHSGSPAVAIRCLGARQQFVSPGASDPRNTNVCAECVEKDRDGSDNANSIVTLISFGNFRFFDGGDLTWNQEMKLVCPNNLIGQVDVYQVTHHGLDSSNNPVVLKTIQPTVAIMNNGETKGCLPEVFANLRGTASIKHIYQMHKNLRPDGEVNNTDDHLIANHEGAKECKGEFILLTVAADSSSYSVSVPSQGTTNSYDTRPKS
ncbi:MAG: MBL fold metallo-hydrolase [Planctomycetales bacterium]|nr:MBL fold metallo-hydrolase [Planctomycetales bacterium]